MTNATNTNFPAMPDIIWARNHATGFDGFWWNADLQVLFFNKTTENSDWECQLEIDGNEVCEYYSMADNLGDKAERIGATNRLPKALRDLAESIRCALAAERDPDYEYEEAEAA